MHPISWSKLTKMSDNSNNVHFSGVRFICFARADNGKMRAANLSYALKMNIIVILTNFKMVNLQVKIT